MNHVVQLGVEVTEEITRIRAKKHMLDLALRVFLQEQLIKRLDPEHMYVYSEEYGAFIREPIDEESDNTG
jgi:hypothetical protein